MDPHVQPDVNLSVSRRPLSKPQEGQLRALQRQAEEQRSEAARLRSELDRAQAEQEVRPFPWL